MKYRNVKTNGYHSRREANRAAELHMLAQAGKINELKEQAVFHLIPRQEDREGNVLEWPTRYIADFVYADEAGAVHVEDVKGIKTKDYILKRKLMLWIHGIRIEEV